VLLAIAGVAAGELLSGLVPDRTLAVDAGAPGAGIVAGAADQRGPTDEPIAPVRRVTPVDLAPGDATLAGAVDPTVGTGREAESAPSRPDSRTEDATLRSDRSRTFANPDGTYSTEYSQRRLNFRDADGVWQAIDLGLEPARSDGELDLRVRALDREVEFGSLDAEAGLASISDGTDTLRLRALGYGAAREVDTATSRVSFASTGTGGEVWVRPTDTGFEFGLTLERLSQTPSALFALDAGGRVVRLDADGATVVIEGLIDGRPQAIGRIDAPTLFDAAGVMAPDGAATVQLVAAGDVLPADVPASAVEGLAPGEVLLVYRIDPVWLAEPARTFPVTLDPTVCIGAGSSGAGCNAYNSSDYAEHYVDQGHPTTAPTLGSYLRVGYTAAGDGNQNMRSLVYFPSVAWNDGAQVISADLALHQIDNFDASTTPQIQARLINATDGWGSSSTWNDVAAAVDTAYNSPTVAPCSTSSTDCTLHINVAAAVRAWYTRRGAAWEPNIGLQLWYANESSSNLEVRFDRGTDATPADRPLLTITWLRPRVDFAFDTATLGDNYAPSSMVTGQPVRLPINVTNNNSGFTFNRCDSDADPDCYKVGYRWFDAKGTFVTCPAPACTVDLPNNDDIGSGEISVLFALEVTPPAAAGQYTLRLDLVHRLGGSSGVFLQASDWAKPTLYYSRDKESLAADNTRWVGTSYIQRADFPISVTQGAGTATGLLQSVTTGDGGSLGINLASHNLHFEANTGLGFVDLGGGLGLAYGYDRANVVDCTGILLACGWYTSWDERITRRTYDGFDFTYQGPSGNRAFASTDGIGQITSGAPVQLTRPRVTWLDESPLAAATTGGVTEVTAVSQGITGYNNSSWLTKQASNTDADLGNVERVSLTQYPYVSFAARTTVAGGTAVSFKIHNATDSSIADKWVIYTVGTGDFSRLTGKFIALGGSPIGAWVATTRRSLYGDIDGDATFGGPYDEREVTAMKIQYAGAGSSGWTYLDAVRFQPRATTTFGPNFTDDVNPPWTTNGTLAALESTDFVVGTKSLRITPATVGNSPACSSLAGATCWSSFNLTGWPIATWSWKKLGGTSIALKLTFEDQRAGSDGGTGFATGTLTYYAGTEPSGLPTCGGVACAIRIDDALPTGWTRVRRNIVDDARQVLNFFNDDPGGSSPGAPPSQGPTPDPLRLVSITMSAVDGSGYGLFDGFGVQSAPDTNGDTTSGQYPQVAGDDFTARYADGSVHYFNSVGLLTGIDDRDANSTRFDYNLDMSKVGQAAYSLGSVETASDGTTSGTWTYVRKVDVARASPTGFKQTTFTESLGSTGPGGVTPAGRRADFFVAASALAGSDPTATYNTGDLVRVSPARNSSGTACDSNTDTRPTGCLEFSYTNSTNHSLKEVRDPRWDGSTSGTNAYRLVVGYSGVDPISIADASHSSAFLLYVPSFDRSTAFVDLYRVAIWQDAAMRAAGKAADIRLSADGTEITAYVPKACSGTCSTTPGTWPAAGADGDRLRTNMFDGLARISAATTFRTAGANATTTRRGTEAGARVDTLNDPLRANEVAWTQDANQYAAWVAAVPSEPKESDGFTPTAPYRTRYEYDADHRPLHVVTPVANLVGDVAYRDVRTTYDPEGHPIATDDATYVANPGFESVTVDWTTLIGTIAADTANKYTGNASGKLNDASEISDAYTTVQLLAGQTFRLQLAWKAASGSTASYWLTYDRASDGASVALAGATGSTTATSWAVTAIDATLPIDATGLVRVHIKNEGAGQSAWFDDVAVLTSYATTTYAANGLVTDAYALDGASPTGTIRMKLAYVATATLPAVAATTATQNYLDGTAGPDPDEDVATSQVYDRWGRVTTTTDADGVSASTTYVASGNGYQTDVASTADDPDNGAAATAFTYDRVGNRLTTTAPTGEVTSATYDLRNHVLVQTAGDGTKSASVFNNYGQRTSAIANYLDGVPSGASGLDDVVTTFAYDEFGNVTATVADQGTGLANVPAEATYDLMGHVVRSTAHTGNRVANPGFESAATATNWLTNAGYSVVTSPVHAGARALKTVVPTPSAGSYAQTFRLSLSGGSRYAASGWVAGKAGNSASAATTLRIRFYMADGSYVDSTVGSATKGTNTSWTQISGTVTAPVGAVEGYPFFSLAATTAGDVIYVDDVSLDELRDTTSYFDAAGNPAASQGPAEPGSSSPACPGAAGEYCNTVATIDRNGRATRSFDAYGKELRTFYDLGGRQTAAIRNYVNGIFNPALPAQDLATVSAFDIAGRQIAAADELARTTLTDYDALGRATLTTRHDSSFAKSVYSYAGRIDRSSAIAVAGTADAALTWTKQLYDADGRIQTTLEHYFLEGGTAYARTMLDTFENTAAGWSGSASGTFTTAASDTAPSRANDYVSSVSARTGRDRLQTNVTTVGAGVWRDYAGPTFLASRTYHVHADVLATPMAYTAYFGRDLAGSNYASSSFTSTGAWETIDIDWQPSADTSFVHFAIRKTASGAASILLDNVLVTDITNDTLGQYNLPSETVFDAAGRVVQSILPPGTPTDRPLSTMTAYDLASRPVSVSAGAQLTYSHALYLAAGLVGYWPLDERSGTSAADKDGTNPGTYQGGYTQAVAGGVDETRSAVSLDGVSGQVSVPDASALDVTNNVTLEYWVRSDVLLDSSKPANTWFGGVNKASTYGLGWTTYISGGGWRFQVKSGATTYTVNSAATKVEPNRWYHVVGTYNNADLKLYVDGVLMNTNSIGAKTIDNTANALTIGNMSGYWTGAMDEVALYNTALSATTVSSHYATGRSTSIDARLTTRTTYDRLGRATDTADPAGTTTHAGYDRLGRQTLTIANYRDGATTGGTASDDVRSTFGYNAAGELLTYCPAGAVAASTCSATDLAAPTAWHYDYDAVGHQTTTIPPVNTTVTLLDASVDIYEAAGRLLTSCQLAHGTNASCAGSPARHTDYTYDSVGRTTSAKTYLGAGTSGNLKLQTDYEYLGDGAIETVASNDLVNNANDDTLDFTFDAMGRPDQVKDGATVLTDNAWNADDTLASRTDGTQGATAFGYDWAQRITSVDPPDSYVTGTVTRKYRFDGLLASQSFPSSITETLAYDAVKRPTSISLGSAGSISQTFSRAGNVITDGRSLSGITGDAGTGTQSFSYDGLSRLVGSTGLALARSYQYDLDGNRTRRVEGSVTTDITYDRADQVISQVIGGTTKTFAYDRFGNLTQGADANSALTTYGYDTGDRLTAISPPGGGATQVTFTLDALDRHATRSLGGTATDAYAYLDAAETAWQTGTGAGTTGSLLDADGSRLAVKSGSTVSWLVFDLHGSVVALCTAGTSTVSDAYRFDGFGQQIAQVEPTTNPFRYRGLLNIGADAVLGALLDMGARDYSPQLGVFTQLDTVAGSAANPMTMNRFLYALANPATLIDPDGHAAYLDMGDSLVAVDMQTKEPIQPSSSLAPPSSTADGGAPPIDLSCYQWLGSPCATGTGTSTASSANQDPGGVFSRPDGSIVTNLECLQRYGLMCADVVIDWGSSPTNLELGGWSPEEYLAGSSTVGARKTLWILAALNKGDYGPLLFTMGEAGVQIAGLAVAIRIPVPSTTLAQEVETLPLGSRPFIREVSSEGRLFDLWKRRTWGGEPVSWPKYPGQVVRTPGGDEIGIRVSGDWGLTLDIRTMTGDYVRIHIGGT
jgi:RHS repeat-associated protein